MAYLKYLSEALFSKKSVPSFFREEGIKKVDIDFGYYIERSEEQKILFSIFQKGKHLVVGKPASGKTSLIRKVGYLLEKQGDYHVLLLDAGDIDFTNINDVLDEINEAYKSFGSQLFMIIDDIHRSFEATNEVLFYLFDKNINCLLSSRPSYRYFVDIRKTNLLIELEKKGLDYVTELDGKMIYEDLLSRISKSFPKFPTNREIKKLKSMSSGDLWIFGRLLNSYAENHTFNFRRLYKNLLHDIEKMEKKYNEPLSHCIQELSLFGQYEIPVFKEYIVEKYSLKIVEILVKEYFVFKKGNDLSFFHSSLSSLYVNTFFEEKEKNKIFVKYMSDYLLKYTMEVKRCFARIGIYPEVTERLLMDKNILNTMVNYFSSNTIPLLDYADTITDICRHGTNKSAINVTRALSESKKEVLEKVNSEESLFAIGYFLNSIPWETESSEEDDSIALDNNVFEVDISDSDEQCKYQLSIQNINTDELNIAPVLGCSRYVDKDGAFFCAKSQITKPTQLNQHILQELDYSILAQKINISSDIYRTYLILNLFYWVNKSLSFKLFSLISPENEKKIDTLFDQDKKSYALAIHKLFESDSSEILIEQN